MSIKYLNKAFDYPLADTGAKFVLVVLCDHADSDGFCYPSMETISKHTGQSIRTVQRGVKKLEELGLIRREERRNNQGYKSSDAYYVLDDKLSPDKNDVSHQSNCPVHIESKDSIEPSIEPSQSKPKKGFDEFYDAFPQKMGKQSAEKAYNRALKTKGVTHAILLDGARRFAKAHAAARTEKRFIAHPTTWLNGGRWEDDLSGITARSNSPQPAANARGSQFGALMAAASELMQESGPGESMGQAGLPEWGLGSPFGLQSAAGHGQTGLPQLTDRGDTASGHTIDHDGFDPADG